MRPLKNFIEEVSLCSLLFNFYLFILVCFDIFIFRLERFAMLESNTFLENLLKVVCKQRESGDKGQVNQCIALDILNWIAAIRLSRIRCCHSSLLTLQIDFIKMVESYLPHLIKCCFVLGGRSVAQKCVKLFTLCSE